MVWIRVEWRVGSGRIELTLKGRVINQPIFTSGKKNQIWVGIFWAIVQ